MKVSVDTWKILGTKIQGDNPLPVFRDIQKDKPSRGNGTLSQEEEKLLGVNTGYRVLPYRIIDKYDRKKKNIELNTAVIENENLVATFLPEYGGRLWSLKSKKTGKEILYTNPVFQPANLGIRNAWFSGGVEWNCGQYGHVVYSASPVFFAKIVADNGEEFLRMYEFERMKRLFVQIDFHLPPEEEALCAHVTIYNEDDVEHSMYWWSNIAIQSTKQLRVFSGTSDVIYLDPSSISDNKNPVRIFGRAQLPFLPTLPGRDSTYPANATYSNEFFFQNSDDVENCWSAAVYETGKVFYETSTLPLRFRKMFCWGSHEGGQRWCEYLATREDGDYVELQAGLTPTQLNGLYIPPRTSWSFTQIIGETAVKDASPAFDENYGLAQRFVQAAVRRATPVHRLVTLSEKFRERASIKTLQILSSGSGWGALEEKRGGRIPDALNFPVSTLDHEQDAWIQLLDDGFIKETDIYSAPPSWMVDDNFLPLLQESLNVANGDHYLSRLYLGVMLYEIGRRDEGVAEWKTSLKMRPSPFALRNLAYDAKLKGNLESAIHLMKEAVSLEKFSIDKGFSEELMEMLIEAKQFEDAWDFYWTLPDSYRVQDRLTMLAGVACIELDSPDYAFVEELFVRDLSCIREGDNTLTDLFFRYHVRKRLSDPANTLSLQEVENNVLRHCKPPRHIDFRMVE